ncbi:MAG: hypothetical protein A2428_02305 [Bdellovibrionales bacterium RIFOXYC1_FULL_54_43]|nr:MAG: hypothetical protein A2428_02305 [Bdellovibrionales bacterium RIFOXYC1_FULL_54_43]OFZ83625.1 MAG: hypothetical protein A2603_03865 [Bdellovibrionales bacterium RIFOXYD1_FULL_55_31]
MKIALFQMDIAWLDFRANLNKIRNAVEDAEAQGSRILVLPEMALSGFCMEREFAAKELGSPELLELASMTRGKHILVFAGAAIKNGGKYTNECLVLRNGEILTSYAKMNLFPVTNEQDHYEPGNRLLTVEYEGYRFTPLICFDTRFIGPFTQAAAEGTDAFIIIASWPDVRAQQWKILLSARAMDTQSFVLGVNRIGSGGGMGFSGDCMVVGPSGKPMFEYSSNEKLIVTEVDFGYARKLRETFPAIAKQHQNQPKVRLEKLSIRG